MDPEETIRILIADDHLLVREALATVLGSYEGMEICALACDAEEAVRLFHRHRPEVALIDLRMPPSNALMAIRAIRKEFPAACIIGMLTFDMDAEISPALAAGATECLLKSSPVALLVATIRKGLS